MPGDEASETWYVRARGRILGPLTWSQLCALRDRGQLARFDQVSRDRQEWMPADRLEALFPVTGSSGAFVAGSGPLSRGTKRDPAPSSEPTPHVFELVEEDHSGSRPPASSADGSNEWYYAEAGTPQGPVGLPEVARLASEGRVGPSTLYWRSGLDQWTPGADILELSRLWPSTRTSSAPTTPAGPTLPVAPLAMISLISNLLCGVGNLAAVVVGVMALRQIARSGGTLSGRRQAIAGIALGGVGLLLSMTFYHFLASRPTVP